MIEEKREKFESIIEKIKSELGEVENKYPTNILEISKKVYFNIEHKKKQGIVDAVADIIILAVREGKYNPVDFSYPSSELPENEEELFEFLFDDFNIKLSNFIRSQRGVKFFLGFISSIEDPFKAIERRLAEGSSN